ncbi:MAG: hypothetical protein M3P93_09870 [Actinomycetota bacterium]|nr:hypothetical protein [Actinomycetota bacterium]
MGAATRRRRGRRGPPREVGPWESDLLRANAIAVAHLADRVVLLRLTGGMLRSDEHEVVRQLRAVLL